MSTPLPFEKWEGLGNDFVVLLDPAGPMTAARAAALCDRHRGVGADGVLVVPAGPGPLRMEVWNADGSRSEMCGNGLRCVALALARAGRVGDAPFTVETLAGPHRCRVVEAGDEGWVEVDMRPPTLRVADLPFDAPADPFVDGPLEAGGVSARFTAVGLGNPHVVTFDPLPPEARAALAPRLERDPRFPNRVNVGFATVSGPAALELAVWERGVGFTRACGTGACAAAAAAVETGRAPRHAPIEVTLPGGPLRVTIGEAGAPARMAGPARRVFDGVAR